MRRPRIYELAKDWGVASQAILAQLRKLGSAATTAHNTISEDEAAKVKALLSVPTQPAPVVGQQRLVSARGLTNRRLGISSRGLQTRFKRQQRGACSKIGT
jgi:hypothetical protein